MANIKPILDSTKISLQKEAADTFASAVEDFARGKLAGLGGPGAPDSKKSAQVREPNTYYSTSYAAALSGATSFRPKLKFLFKVEFVFTEEAKNQFPDVFRAATSNDFTFLVKSVDRPKIDFEYEDDVNMYNFRTKVLKKIRHRELTITFFDDVGNRVLDFFRALMMMHSPITRRQLVREKAGYAQRIQPPDAHSTSTGHGMAFSQPSQKDLNDTAIRGTVNSPVGNVIQTIRVKQMYVNPGERLESAAQEVIFDFLNARLVSFDLDDLSHEASDANIMTMQFDYDWMEVIKVGALEGPDGPTFNVTVPGISGTSFDTSPNGKTGSNGGNPAGNGNGFGGAIANILTNQAGRAAQSVTSSAINRAVQTIAGKGQFASMIGSQVSNVLGGLVGASARSLATGVTTTSVNHAAAGLSSLITAGGISAVNGMVNGVVTNAVSNAAGMVGGAVKNIITPPVRALESQRTAFDSAVGGPVEYRGIVTSERDGDDYKGAA